MFSNKMIPSQIDFQEDILKIKNDPSVKEIISNENFIFSDKIIKINRFGFHQVRILIITNNAIYNLKQKTLQRRLLISKLKGISISSFSYELVFHGNEEEYDYHYISFSIPKIVYIVEKCFELLTGNELQFAFHSNPHLKNMVTSKKEKKDNPKFSRMDDSELSSINEYIKQNCKFGKDLNSGNDYDDTMNKYEKMIRQYEQEQQLLQSQRLNKDTSQNSSNNKSWDNLLEDNVTLLDEDINVNCSPFVNETEIKFSDFEFKYIIGKGKYMTTYLASFLFPTQNITHYAIKSCPKDMLMKADFIDNLLIEKKILSIPDIRKCMFLPQSFIYFQTDERVFMGVPFYPGGDLYSLFRRQKEFSEKKVIFYIAQIIIAISHLHKHNIIYRNLKLENILINKNGFIRLVDFTKSKILSFEDDLATSFTCTPEYCPPEVLSGFGQTKSADWWMLGILTYELLFGKTPFQNECIERMFDLISFSSVKFPKEKELSIEMNDFILKLLEKNNETRIGNVEDGEDLKLHPVFRDVNFDDLEKEMLNNTDGEEFFVPDIDEDDDVKYFDNEFVNETFNFDEYIDGYTLEQIKYGNSIGLFNAFS